ncbi:MAG: 2-methylfumaryl-CoA isomerase, partial [Pseudoalteromonas distincta]
DPGAPAQPAARLGQHTEEVLAERLGLDAGEIARLHDAGIVASA